MDRVQLTKYESTALGGQDSDALPYPAPLDPQEDAIEAAGVYLQDASNRDENTLISRSGDDMTFKDVNNSGGLTLSQLVRSVSKVGTPANNQLAVWTGDGTLEGESELTYDGSTLTISGDLSATNIAGTKVAVAGPIRITEVASPDADEAGKGQIWCKDNTPNDLYFRDDTGVDHLLSLTETDYAKLTGRSGGQTLQGGTEASQDLTLVSTASGTRGHIYLGAAQTSAFDETNGRLGINEASPSYPLHVKSAGDAYGVAHTDGTHTVGTLVGSSAGWFGTISNHRLGLGVNGGTALTIDTSGNIGIGTTAIPHGGVGSAMLALDGATPYIQFTTATDDYPILQICPAAHDSTGLYFDCYYDGAQRSSASDSNAIIGKQYDFIGFQVDSGVTAGNALSLTNAFGVQCSTGYTMFGNFNPTTTPPDTLVHVWAGSAGTVSALSGTVLTVENSTTAYISLLTPNTSTSGILFGDPDDNDIGGIKYDHSADSLTLRTGNGDRIIVTSNGWIGTGGETTPLGRVHVKGADVGDITPSTFADELVLENNGMCGMTIYSAAASSGYVMFGDVDDDDVGQIRYDHSTDTLSFTDGTTGTKTLAQLAAASGVSVSGTPADNQIAVWTNATTIEGTSGLTYDGSIFVANGLARVKDPPNVWGGSLEVGPYNASSGYLDISLNNITGGATTYSELWWQFGVNYCTWALGASGPSNDEPGQFWLFHGRDKDTTTHDTFVFIVDDDDNIVLSADGPGFASNSYVRVDIDGSELARFTSTGLHVQGTAYPTVRIESTDTEGGTLQLDSTGGYYQLYVDEDGDLMFYNGSAVKFSVLTGGRVGIGTGSPPIAAASAALLTLEGASSSVTGPHIQFGLTADTRPIMQILNWDHDYSAIGFDCYFETTWKSSDTGSNFQIFKNSDKLLFQYDSGIALGSTISWNAGIVMDTSGQVGINNDTPGSLLHVKGSAFPTIRIESTDGDGGTLRLISDSGYWDAYVEGGIGLGFYDGTATRVMFLDGGEVGIGTTTVPHGVGGGHGAALIAIDGTASSAAGPHLQVTTATDDFPVLQLLNWSHDNVAINFDCYYDGTTWDSSDAGSNYQIYKNADKLQIRYDNGVAADSVITWNPGIVLDGSGSYTKVGIGTDSPAAPDGTDVVHLVGSGYPAVRIQSTDSDGGNLALQSDTDEFQIYMQGDTYLGFYNGTATTVAFGLDGDVGIGIVDADSRLHVLEASAGTVTALTNTVLTVENSTNCYLSFLTPNTASSGLVFGCSTDGNNLGSITYNHSTNQLSFTDETTGTKTLQELAASGGVQISGTPADNQIAVWTNSTTVEGDANLTFSGTYLQLSGSSYPQLYVVSSTTSGGSLLLQSSTGSYEMYLQGADLRFYESGTDRITFKDGGNIGVATTNPQKKIHAVDASTSQLRLELNGTNYVDIGPANSSWCHFTTTGLSSGFYFDNRISVAGGIFAAYLADLTLQAPQGTARMTILNASGYVGINETSPDTRMHISDSAAAISDAFLTIENTNGSQNNAGGISFHRTEDERARIHADYFNGLTFWTKESTGSLTERMNIQDSGNVGINTTGPEGLLHVKTGDSGATPTTQADDLIIESNGTQVGLQILGGTNNVGAIYFGDPSSALVGGIKYGHTSDTLTFRLASGDKCTLAAISGSLYGLGINETSPMAYVHVFKQSTGVSSLSGAYDGFCVEGTGPTGITILSGTSSTGAIAFGDANDADIGIIGYDHSANAMTFTTSTSEAMRIDTSGNVLIGATASPTANGNRVLVLGDNGSDPTPGTATAGLFAKTVSTVVEMFAVDSAGNASQLSPHDPETGEWIFYSKNVNTGVVKKVNMEKLVALVEKLSGENLMQEWLEDCA